ncbi:MAG TPA: glycine--tRNA ligase, partial [Candidatus Altiarchaeales archaeon]|nr:glycine--tRNA ligase [Candidatus Altiarchaeales archaeon]
VGISDRTDYDLSAHMKLSGQSMEVNYEGRKFAPHVIEIAYGIDRPFYCVIESCIVKDRDRTYFRFPPIVAPYRAAVFPLVRKDGLDKKAKEVFKSLVKKGIYCIYDQSGSIGRRYARADEIGIPRCITIDYDTMKDDAVTIRDRDTRKQKRIKIGEIDRAL